MTPTELRAALKILGLSIGAFGREFNLSRSTAFRYATGKTKINQFLADIIRQRVHDTRQKSD